MGWLMKQNWPRLTQITAQWNVSRLLKSDSDWMDQLEYVDTKVKRQIGHTAMTIHETKLNMYTVGTGVQEIVRMTKRQNIRTTKKKPG